MKIKEQETTKKDLNTKKEKRTYKRIKSPWRHTAIDDSDNNQVKPRSSTVQNAIYEEVRAIKKTNQLDGKERQAKSDF